ncbi:thioesterase [Aeromicrobium sp. IC_218]|uniref:thioesterase family protein n=1 Tax=Aeromicrobium sp. IC_218 TaxID=2545468 RepID=UPI00104002C3|nr:thioesterase [Aeromicrobium sp. IC_218]TCI97538.1 thioesterase [Aeromicrobium sp. IC_218]
MATLTHTVTEAHTAQAVGSGDVPVLGTPVLLAWLEATTVAALETELTPGTTSVGTRVEVEHSSASAVGATVTTTADVLRRDGRLVIFTVAAHEGARLVASGEVRRVVVDRERFLARVTPVGD